MHIYIWKLKVWVAQSCLTLCDPMDCGLPGSPVHGILQARILEWHLLQRIVPTQELNLGLLYCRWILSLLSYQGILCIYIYICEYTCIYILIPPYSSPGRQTVLSPFYRWRNKLSDFPGGPVAEDSAIPMQGVWVQSRVVRELEPTCCAITSLRATTKSWRSQIKKEIKIDI